jgi:DNA-binding NtrC family response regulator
MAVLNRAFTLTPVDPASPEENMVFYRDVSTFLAGPSPAMSLLLSQIRRVAPYFRTALLTGERGCGEEAVARSLHRLSPLKSRPFLELTPAEAELRFDHRISYDSVVSEGMLYLPQPERISPFAQKSLLRLLGERGSLAPRVVAFAERGLRSLVSAGGFSAELADSLGALRISVPLLRERPEDISELLLEMLRDQAGELGLPMPNLASDLLDAGAKQPWPGNFDRLRSVALGLLERATTEPLRALDLEAVISGLTTPSPHDRREVRMISLDRVIQEHIRAVLFARNGNKLRAAEVLGISRSTLYRMLKSQRPLDLLPAMSSDHQAEKPDYPSLRMAS